MKCQSVFPQTNRKLKRMLIPVWLIAMAILAAAYGRSTPPAVTEASPQPTTPPAVAVPDLPPAEIPPSQFLRFNRLTAEDGLSNDQVWGVVQDDHGLDPTRHNDIDLNLAQNLLSDIGCLWQLLTPLEQKGLAQALLRVAIVDNQHITAWHWYRPFVPLFRS